MHGSKLLFMKLMHHAQHLSFVRESGEIGIIAGRRGCRDGASNISFARRVLNTR